jgi:tetratricopeptide (TPR) repeat protein
MGIRFGILFPLLTLLLLVTAACGASAQPTANQLVNAGLIAQNAGRTAEAADDYHKALALDPRNKVAYYDLGVIDQFAGRNASAELEYRTAIQYDPNFANAIYNLAVLRAPAAPTEAIGLYRQVISIQSTYAAAHLNLGFLLIAAGQKVEGKAELDRAVLLNPAFASRIPANLNATPTPTPKH